MIGISTQTASPYFVMLEEKPDESDIERYSRRNSVRATLDGGGVGSDSGYSDTDREIEFNADITEAQKEILKHMIQNYALLNVSTKDGFFVCRFNRFYPGDGEAYLKFLIEE
jgi:hypothetical protein